MTMAYPTDTVEEQNRETNDAVVSSKPEQIRIAQFRDLIFNVSRRGFTVNYAIVTERFVQLHTRFVILLSVNQSAYLVIQASRKKKTVGEIIHD